MISPEISTGDAYLKVLSQLQSFLKNRWVRSQCCAGEERLGCLIVVTMNEAKITAPTITNMFTFFFSVSSQFLLCRRYPVPAITTREMTPIRIKDIDILQQTTPVNPRRRIGVSMSGGNRDYITGMQLPHKYMIKYNNKELPQEVCHLKTSRVNRSNQHLTKNISQICKIPDLGGNAHHRHTAFRSPEERERHRSHIEMFPQRRSKSHKIKYEKSQNSRLRKDVLRRRESKGSRLDLLIILPSNAETNPVQDSTADSAASPDRTLFNNHRMPCNPMHGQYRTGTREDITLGKMKLLTHKSKLTPITEPKQGKTSLESVHKSEQKLKINLVEKLQIHQNRFLQEKEKELKDFLRCEKGISPEQGELARLTGGLNPNSIMNIQSIIPNFTMGQRLSIELKKEKRRTTQPNIQTSQEFYQVDEGGSVQNIYDKSRDSIPKNDYNLYRSKEKMRDYAEKFKASKWKKKVYLSNLTKFNIPFDTYHYRDMLWKINYSNRLFVEPPLEYEHRLKVYVGKGNNSSMVRGLISRRYWFAITERVEQANFIWTQLKELKYYKIQKSFPKEGREKIKGGSYAGNSLYLLQDMKEFKRYWERNRIIEEHCDERLLPRLKNFPYKTVIRADFIKQNRLHNHLINNYVISNKKSLFRILSAYYRQQGLDPFDFIPITYHVCKGLEDPVFLSFQRHYHQLAKQIRKGESNRRNYWIMKPGENSNRGYGIKLCLKLSDIKGMIKQRATWGDGSEKTHIIQSYIERPFLYCKRKFDLRHYMLMTCINGHLKGYWYSQGYVRTTSSQYTLDVSASSVHLTNDAIQKYLPGYGKFEKGNKISYAQLDAYIRKRLPNLGFYNVVYPQMKRIALDIMKASANYLDPDSLGNNFQLFGLDFMIDQKLKVWLIEVNSNPCLQLSCPLLSSIIPNLIQNVLELTMDALFPPAVRYCAKIPRYLGQIEDLNKFQLLFDQRIEQIKQYESPVLDSKLLQEEQQQFQDNEEEWQDNL